MINSVQEPVGIYARALVTALALVQSPATNDGVPRITGDVRRSPLTNPVLTSGFGWRRDPYSGGQRFHAGVDLAAPLGTPVRAVLGGVVVEAGWHGDLGLTVLIDHGGALMTRYAHLGEIDVGRGDIVSTGTIIGKVGRTGRATGPHLHFSVLRDGVPIDPSSW